MADARGCEGIEDGVAWGTKAFAKRSAICRPTASLTAFIKTLGGISAIGYGASHQKVAGM